MPKEKSHWKIIVFVIALLFIASTYGIYQTSEYENKINEMELDIYIMNHTIESQKDVVSHLINKSSECQMDLYEEQWNNTICNSELQYIELNKPTFMKMSEMIATEHEYDPNKYNCQNFTRDLVYALEYSGYDAKKIFGRFKECDPKEDQFQCYHQWTELTIHIESTSGQIIEPSDYEEYYRPIRVSDPT